MPATGFPAGAWTSWPPLARARGSRLVGRYPGWQHAPAAFPGTCFRAPSGFLTRVARECRLFDRCGGSAGWLDPEGLRLLLPVELRRVNRGASTNARDFSCKPRGPRKLQSPPMPAPSRIEQIAERVERLLVRHEEVQRTNALLQDQVNALTRERDALKSRLTTARTRLDALLEQLPADPSQDAPSHR